MAYLNYLLCSAVSRLAALRNSGSSEEDQTAGRQRAHPEIMLRVEVIGTTERHREYPELSLRQGGGGDGNSVGEPHFLI